MSQCLLEGKLDPFLNSDLILGYFFIMANIMVKTPFNFVFVLQGGFQIRYFNTNNGD